jgi:hypothetical protein
MSHKETHQEGHAGKGMQPTEAQAPPATITPKTANQAIPSPKEKNRSRKTS